MSPTPPPGPGASDEQLVLPAGLPARRRWYRRAFRVGMIISLVLHAILILYVSRQLRVAARAFEPVSAVVRRPSGLELIRYREVESPPPTESLVELPPTEEEVRQAEERGEELGVPLPTPGDEDLLGLTNPERLRPREGDPRLWRDFGDEPMPEYLADRYAMAEGVIRRRLGEMLDSLRLSAEQRRRAVEWLMGEGDQQWGVTPEGIVLGGVLIPVNLGSMFAEEGPRGREARQEARDLSDIQRQDLLADVEAIQRERAEAMRRRSQEEIARRSADSLAALADSTPPPEVPRSQGGQRLN